MIKDIFLAIQARLINGNIGILHFDWFNGQYEDNQDSYDTPAVFIEFQPIRPKSLANKVQKADVFFRLHYVTQKAKHTQYGVPEQMGGLAHLEGVNQINKLIHGYSYKKPEDLEAGTLEQQIFNSCSRTDIMPDHNQNEKIVHIQEYRTTAFDYSAVKQLQPAEPMPTQKNRWI